MFRNIATLIVGIVLCGSTPAIAQPNPMFTVFVYNDAGVSRPVLQRSEDIAGKIFQQAGFPVLWKDCNQAQAAIREACSVTPGEITFSIRIVPHSNSLSGEAFGIAFVGNDGIGQQADVFYSGIEQLEWESPNLAGRLLGHVMAHELGHLLLGIKSHSRSGVMQARWTSSELRQISLGTLLFDQRQSDVIKARLLGRQAAARKLEVTAGSADLTRASWPLMKREYRFLLSAADHTRRSRELPIPWR